MFKLTDRFWWPVILESPADGGAMDKHRVELQFLRRSQAEIDKLTKEAKTDRDLCHDVVVGWRGVMDEQGQELTFTSGNFDALLNEIAGATLTVASTYFDVMQGAARRKNLLGLRGIGS